MKLTLVNFKSLNLVSFRTCEPCQKFEQHCIQRSFSFIQVEACVATGRSCYYDTCCTGNCRSYPGLPIACELLGFHTVNILFHKKSS